MKPQVAEIYDSTDLMFTAELVLLLAYIDFYSSFITFWNQLDMRVVVHIYCTS